MMSGFEILASRSITGLAAGKEPDAMAWSQFPKRCIHVLPRSEHASMRLPISIPRARIAFVLLLAAALSGAILAKGCAKTYPNRSPIGETFPSVVGQNLDEDTVRLPDDILGRPSILLVGYAQATQFDIDRWILGLLQADVDAQILEIPTIPGLVPTPVSRWIDDGMRSGIPPQDWAAVVTLYRSNATPVAKLTGNQKKRNTRALVLDHQGTILWFSDLGYSASQALEIKALLENVTSP
jgi:hypothetical protein